MTEHVTGLTQFVNHYLGQYALALLSALHITPENPETPIAELLLTNPLGFGIKDLLEENVYHGALKLIPFVGSISVFVLLSNLLSVIPVFAAPTSNKSVPLACAILTFLYFNWQGIRYHG